MYAGAQDHLAAGLVAGAAEEQGFTSRLLLFDGLYPDLRDAEGGIPSNVVVRLPRCAECAPCRDPGWKEAALGSPDAVDMSPRIWQEDPVIQAEVALDRKEVLRTGVGSGHDNLTRRRTAKHLAVLHSQGYSTAEHWELAGEVEKHSKALLQHLVDHLPEFLEAANRPADIANVIRQGAVRSQPRNTEMVIHSVSRRLYQRYGGEGFTRTNVSNVLAGREREILAMNGVDSGRPVTQILAALLESKSITYDGQKQGRPPPKGALFRFNGDGS